MIAVDSNVLIAAHRVEHPAHEKARSRLAEIAEGPVAWGLPILCVPEFLRVVTHPRVFTPPTSLETALAFIDRLVESPGLRLLFPGGDFWSHLRRLIVQADARGNLVFDAQIAAVCLEHGALTLLSGDRDFARMLISVPSSSDPGETASFQRAAPFTSPAWARLRPVVGRATLK